MIAIRQINRKALIGIVLILTCIGCAYLRKEPGEKKTAESESALPAKTDQTTSRFLHTVRWSGETLTTIAKWYTGKFGNWKALAKANPKLKPEKIIIGNKILIPEDLLKTREPMPRKFLSEITTSKKKKATPPESTSPPEEDNEPELIGPKDYPKK